jgi:predicted O-linked N-acetylglucosamine transferase (SPINDLY family)
LTKNPCFEENIRAEAVARGVDPKRIIFAKNEPLAKHLARVSLADLFLDSLPYSAHTTASDALWVNVPVVTCVGSAFAGRVCQGVLHAIEMPELVTYSLKEYEQLALKLATDNAALSAVRAKLTEKIRTAPLFNVDRFTRHIEWAYEEMYRRNEQGQPPQRIVVPAER